MINEENERWTKWVSSRQEQIRIRNEKISREWTESVRVRSLNHQEELRRLRAVWVKTQQARNELIANKHSSKVQRHNAIIATHNKKFQNFTATHKQAWTNMVNTRNAKLA